MDIERLKEHIDDEAMEYAKNMMENPETHSFGKGIETGVLLCLKAINIEIARQSVTDEAVVDALTVVGDFVAEEMEKRKYEKPTTLWGMLHSF